MTLPLGMAFGSTIVPVGGRSSHRCSVRPCSLAGEIMHPVEFVCNVLIPMFTGPILFASFGGGCHGECVCVYMCGCGCATVSLCRCGCGCGWLLLSPQRHGASVFTVWAWATFRELRGTDAHSDYKLPFHPLRILSPIYGGPSYHSVHHKRETKHSNYGGYLWWDWAMGTAIKPGGPKDKPRHGQ